MKETIPYRGDSFVDEYGDKWVRPYDDMRSFIRSNALHGDSIQPWLKAGDKFIPNPEWEKAKYESAPYIRERDGYCEIFFGLIKPITDGNLPYSQGVNEETGSVLPKSL